MDKFQNDEYENSENWNTKMTPSTTKIPIEKLALRTSMTVVGLTFLADAQPKMRPFRLT